MNHMVQYSAMDASFAALADPTRRGVLESLSLGDASVSELARSFRMTLTGMKKHIQVLENTGLVVTEKVGRVRRCRLGARRLDAETAWITRHQQTVEERFERLGELLEALKGDST